MPTDAPLRATIRYAILELTTLPPTVILWALVLGAADPLTALVIWALRIAATSVVWAREIEPIRRWQRHGSELRDLELLAIDEAMASALRRFTRFHAGMIATSLLLATALAVLGIPRPQMIGPAELVCAAMFAVAILVLMVATQHWMWQPLESSRLELGRLLRERGLSGRRVSSSIVRSQLLLSAGTALAVYVGAAGLGGMLYIEGRRDTALVEQRHLAEVAALQLRSHDRERVEGLVVIDEAELPAMLESSDPADPAALGSRSTVDVDLRRTQVSAAAPIGDGRWVLASTELDDHLGWFVLFALSVGASLAVPLISATVTQARSLAAELHGLGKLTRRVMETGKTRGLERLVSLRNDEVDALVNDFNAMLDMFDELSDAATKVADGDLRVVLERPGDLHDAFRAMIERLHEMVVQIRTTALDLAGAAAEIHSITQEQALAAEHQSTSMREVSETVASLAASAENITQTATSVLENADQTSVTTEAMIAKISELSEQANGVGGLLDVIREVADRSDLLALNGSLEATRVGEVGRGFALVAAEMRRLAERVTQTVSDVRGRVVEIKASGSSAVLAAEDSRKLAEQTAAAARHISLVTGRQSRDTEQVAQTVQTVAGVVIATAGATSQTRAAAEGLRIQAEQLERLTRQFKLRRAADRPPNKAGLA